MRLVLKKSELLITAIFTHLPVSDYYGKQLILLRQAGNQSAPNPQDASQLVPCLNSGEIVVGGLNTTDDEIGIYSNRARWGLNKQAFDALKLRPTIHLKSAMT